MVRTVVIGRTHVFALAPEIYNSGAGKPSLKSEG